MDMYCYDVDNKHYFFLLENVIHCTSFSFQISLGMHNAKQNKNVNEFSSLWMFSLGKQTKKCANFKKNVNNFLDTLNIVPKSRCRVHCFTKISINMDKPLTKIFTKL